MQFEAVQRIAANAIAKGSVLDTARIAGIMGAKRTSDLIPLCHPLALRHIDVDLRVDTSDTPGVLIEATARVEGATGVEMEALTAVAIAALTVIDMIKAVDHWASITDVPWCTRRAGEAGRSTGPKGLVRGACRSGVSRLARDERERVRQRRPDRVEAFGHGGGTPGQGQAPGSSW